jgi:hypothetical protein
MPEDTDRADDDTQREDAPQDERPSLAQRLHAATGDRDAEAEALRRRSPDEIDHDDAKIAVQRAHGEAGADISMPVESHPDEELAVPSDAAAVHEERAG